MIQLEKYKIYLIFCNCLVIEFDDFDVINVVKVFIVGLFCVSFILLLI